MTAAYVPTYLVSYLNVADSLPERLDGAHRDEVEMVQMRLRDLVALVTNRDEQIVKLTRELDRVRPAIQKGSRP